MRLNFLIFIPTTTASPHPSNSGQQWWVKETASPMKCAQEITFGVSVEPYLGMDTSGLRFGHKIRALKTHTLSKLEIKSYFYLEMSPMLPPMPY